jgi:hypothetical protein
MFGDLLKWAERYPLKAAGVAFVIGAASVIGALLT